jgi:two-component system response regulator AtoC
MSNDASIRFLVVDDQQTIRKLCTTIAASVGFSCTEAASGEEALQFMQAQPPDIVLADLRLEQMNGLQFLEAVKQSVPQTEVAIMTGYGSIESAVQAMKLGAYDYVTKPFRVEELKLTLQRMAEKVRLVAENKFLRERVHTELALSGIVGSSPKIQNVLRLISRLKDTTTPVLITGESGTGKELVARAIHFRGALSSRPFVAVDCGSLVPTLIESELFGYEKGAFTGAMRSKEGLFESADGGTIFLDEIGELPLELQAKLLRVLQEKDIRRVGSTERRPVNVRVIAATNRDLETAYKSGTFRKDLYFRLNVVTVHLPSLRERKADIPMLVQWFLDRDAAKENIEFSGDAMGALLAYEWPGNVRELENCIARAIALRNGHVIGLADLPESIRRIWALPTTGPALPDVTHLEHLERVTIERVFTQVKGDKQLARKMLGISRATLYRKLKRYNIGALRMPSAMN